MQLQDQVNKELEQNPQRRDEYAGEFASPHLVHCSSALGTFNFI